MSGKVTLEASYDGLRCSDTKFVQLEEVSPIVSTVIKKLR